MANIKSAKKRVLIDRARGEKNKAVKSGVKTSIKKVNAAVESGDKAAAEAAFAVAAKKLDKAAGRGVIHKNQAANRKSGLALAINAL